VPAVSAGDDELAAFERAASAGMAREEQRSASVVASHLSGSGAGAGVANDAIDDEDTVAAASADDDDDDDDDVSSVRAKRRPSSRPAAPRADAPKHPKPRPARAPAPAPAPTPAPKPAAARWGGASRNRLLKPVLSLLVSALETNTWSTAFKFCFQCELAALQMGRGRARCPPWR